MTTTFVAASTPEPHVVAVPASVVLASAAPPPVAAPSAQVTPRAVGATPVRPAGSAKPSPRVNKTSMPLPALPNF